MQSLSSLSLTVIIVGITVLISLVLMHNRDGKNALIFHPVTIRENGQWYRFLSSGFIHADMMHLFINMFVLWMFGTVIEQGYYPTFLGGNVALKFLGLYFGGIVVSSIPSFLRHKNDASYAALGASGGVASVVFAAIIFAPWQNLYLYGAVPIPQILAGVGYIVYSWYKDKNAQDNIGHMAHLTGAIWGFVYTAALECTIFNRNQCIGSD